MFVVYFVLMGCLLFDICLFIVVYCLFLAGGCLFAFMSFELVI